MLNGKKTAVIMPAYNAEKTLEKTYSEIYKEIVDEIILTDEKLGGEYHHFYVVEENVIISMLFSSF